MLTAEQNGWPTGVIITGCDAPERALEIASEILGRPIYRDAFRSLVPELLATGDPRVAMVTGRKPLRGLEA